MSSLCKQRRFASKSLLQFKSVGPRSSMQVEHLVNVTSFLPAASCIRTGRSARSFR